MSKAGLIIFCILYLTFYSVVCTTLGIGVSDVGGMDAFTTPSDPISFLVFVGEIFTMLFNLVTFTVVGMSDLVILLTVYPAVVGIVIGILWFIKG